MQVLALPHQWTSPKKVGTRLKHLFGSGILCFLTATL